MNQHLYLRAYMAGIVFPTAFLMVALSIFCIVRFALGVPAPISQLIIFPMAIVPNLFGLWNMLFVKLHGHWRVPIGLHGALLPFVIAPIGVTFAIAMGFIRATNRGFEYFGILLVPYGYLIFAPLIGVAVYYLIWKYGVGFFNRVLGLPC